MSSPRESDWRLFADWCAATGHVPAHLTWDDAARFLHDCPTSSRNTRRRARAVITICAAAGNPLDAPEYTTSPPSRAATREGEGWLDLDAALDRVSVWTWPRGVTGRRDSALMVAIAVAGLTRKRLTYLTSDQIHWEDAGVALLDGQRITETDNPESCPTCRLWRWAETATAENERGRSAAIRTVTVAAATRDGHVCHTSPPFGDFPVFCPSIDRHGWFGPTLTARSMTRIMAARFDPTSALLTAADQPVEASAPAREPGTPPTSLEGMTKQWDDVDSKIDALLAASIDLAGGEGFKAEGKGYLRGRRNS